MDTEPLFDVEGLDEIMMRDRPSLTNIWPEMFGDLAPSSLINVYGASGTGKSTFLHELMAKIVMRDDLNNSEAIFIDLERKFNVLRFSEICAKLLAEDSKDIPDCQETIIKPRMKKLHLINLKNFNESFFLYIENQLRENSKISMVLIDSLSEFFEIDPDTESDSSDGDECNKEEKEGKDRDEIVTSQDEHAATQSLSSALRSFLSSSASSLDSSDDESSTDGDVSRHMEKLREIAEKCRVCIVSEVPTCIKVREGLANIKVFLTKVNDKAFHMKINDRKEAVFTIGFYGMEAVYSPSLCPVTATQTL